LPERLYTGVAQLGVGTLGDDVAALPVVAAVEGDRDVSPTEAAYHTLRVVLFSGQTKPEHVHRWRGLYKLEAS